MNFLIGFIRTDNNIIIKHLKKKKEKEKHPGQKMNTNETESQLVNYIKLKVRNSQKFPNRCNNK